MKSKLFTLLFLCVVFVPSCEDDEKSYKFEATVLEEAYDNTMLCGPQMYFIKITKSHDNIELYTSDSTKANDSIYSALYLPEGLRTEGLEIKLNLKKASLETMPECYIGEMPVILEQPIVYISEAEKK